MKEQETSFYPKNKNTLIWNFEHEQQDSNIPWILNVKFC